MFKTVMIGILLDIHDQKTTSYVLVETQYTILFEVLIYEAEATIYITLYYAHEYTTSSVASDFATNPIASSINNILSKIMRLLSED